MNKSEIFTTIAGLPDDDARLAQMAAILNGKAESKHPASLRLFRICDAVRASGFSRSTIYRLITDGRLKTVEVRRGSKRIPEDELRSIVEGRKK